MIIIICLDDNNGLMFNNRRQSQDSKIREDIIKHSRNTNLWMNQYSIKQFNHPEKVKNLIVDENFLTKAGENDFCFVEDQILQPYISKIEKLVVYRWNRKYPSDFYFDIDINEDKWVLLDKKNFIGTSHNITKEIYAHKTI